MGTYTNIIFEKENISINTKHLYPEDVIDNFNKHGKIFYTEYTGGYANDVCYSIFGNKELQGYNEGVNIYDNASYNFKYNSETNCLFYATVDDFFVYLVNTAKYNSFKEIEASQKNILRQAYWYKNLQIINVFPHEGRVVFKQENLYYGIAFSHHNNTSFVKSFYAYTDEGSDLMFDTRDIQANIIRFFPNRNDFINLEDVALCLQKCLDLSPPNTTLKQNAAELMRVYQKNIKPKLSVLLEVLINYKNYVRIEILNNDK